MNLCRLDRFLERKLRQNGRQPLRQHRLSRAGRANHQNVVAARGGDFERAFRLRLPANVAEICSIDLWLRSIRRHRRQNARLGAKMSQKRGQMRSANDAQRSHRRRFVCVRGGNDQLADFRVASDRRGNRQRAADRRDGSVKRQFADENAPGDLILVQQLRRMQDAEGDGKVEAGAFLFHIGGREIDGDVARRKPEAAVVKRGADARVRLAYGGVGKTDERETGLRSLRSIDFDSDANRVNA